MERVCIFLFLALLWNPKVYAQNFDPGIVVLPGNFNDFIVEGLKVGTTEYSDEDIINAFGDWNEKELTVSGMQYKYYRPFSLSPHANKIALLLTVQKGPMDTKGRISDIIIYDSKYCINNNIYVGNNISLALRLPGEWIDRPSDTDNKGYFIWRPKGWIDYDLVVCPKFYYNAEGKITSVKFCAN